MLDPSVIVNLDITNSVGTVLSELDLSQHLSLDIWPPGISFDSSPHRLWRTDFLDFLGVSNDQNKIMTQFLFLITEDKERTRGGDVTRVTVWWKTSLSQLESTGGPYRNLKHNRWCEWEGWVCVCGGIIGVPSMLMLKHNLVSYLDAKTDLGTRSWIRDPGHFQPCTTSRTGNVLDPWLEVVQTLSGSKSLKFILGSRTGNDLDPWYRPCLGPNQREIT